MVEKKRKKQKPPMPYTEEAFKRAVHYSDMGKKILKWLLLWWVLIPYKIIKWIWQKVRK